MDFNFFNERQKHRVMDIRIRAWLLGLDDIHDSHNFFYESSCKIEYWHTTQVQNKMKGIIEIKQLMEVDGLFHESLNQVIKYRNSGEEQQAKEELKKLDQLTNRLNNLLIKVEDKIQSFK